MTEEELEAEIEKEPFVPFRLRLLSGKTVDVMAANAAHTLHDSVLVLKNPTIGTPRAVGYDVLAYRHIERIERLEIGKRPAGNGKRKRP
jgi:hypothetical protein